MIIYGFLFISGCAKDRIKDPINSKKETIKSSLRTGNPDSLSMGSRIALAVSPLRDILMYNPSFLNEDWSGYISPQSNSDAAGGPDYHCCNGICLTVPTNPDPGTNYHTVDAFGNTIQFVGQYGNDPRQVYYVYLPTNANANTPIVVMIPGGGWFSGPSGYTPGFPYNWGDNSNESMVKDLLDNGYAVVAVMYRLVQYGKDVTEFSQNTISWDDQIDDVESAVTHIRTNFPTCLYGYSLNANKIHVLGESAGGQLALMYSYTRASNAYLKSVVSMYAPTNINSFGDKLDDNTYPYTCGSALQLNNLPYWFGFDNTYINSIYESISPFMCSQNIPNYKVIFTYNLLQSAVQTPTLITNPATNTTLQQYSPQFRLNGTNTIPTFILHPIDANDHIVPYTQSTVNMNASLSSFGGLINNTPYIYINNNPLFQGNIPNSNTYYSNPKKNLVKLYHQSDHGWLGLNLNQTPFPGLRDNVRSEVIKWFNGH